MEEQGEQIIMNHVVLLLLLLLLFSCITEINFMSPDYNSLRVFHLIVLMLQVQFVPFGVPASDGQGSWQPPHQTLSHPGSL